MSSSAVDVFAPEHRTNPYPAYDELRRTDPIHWNERKRGWVLTRYADVVAGLRDHRLSAARIPQRATAGLALDTFDRIRGNMMLYVDPPRHTRLRSLVNQAFTPRTMNRIRSDVQHLADELLAGISAGGRFDLVSDYAQPLTITVIARLVGIDPRDQAAFIRWTSAFLRAIGGSDDPDIINQGAEGAVQLERYLQGRLAERRATSPVDDLVGGLIAAHDRDDVLDDAELVATIMLLIFAGHETSANLIAGGALALLRTPDQLGLFIDHPETTGEAVEELLRYETPVQMATRIATDDLSIGEVTIRQGDRVHLVLGAANHDPAQFREPGRLDLRRRPNAHLAFGYGIHFCLGAALARLEGQVALRALFDRHPRLQLGLQDPEWHWMPAFRFLKSLPVSVE